ncbi:MAG: Flp pilus assembly protein CpaB [Actinomycetota bacterium]|nr:Flp pilus assembly protein CpaB [Actinomycetota bacterium]
MGKRSNLIVTLGLAVFIVGAAATYLVVRNGDGGGGSASSAGKVPVLVAEKPIPAGTTGTAVVTQGMIKTRNVDANAKPATAITDASQLAGKTVTLGVAEGQILTLDQFQTAQTRIGTLKIPDGKTALALQLANVPGVAGFAGAGDQINVYGVVKPGSDPKQPAGMAHLIMQNTEVLNVIGATLAATQGQPGGTGLVYLLAVTPAEAERLIYLSTFEQLYFSLVSKDAAPVGATPGSSITDALKQF